VGSGIARLSIPVVSLEGTEENSITFQGEPVSESDKYGQQFLDNYLQAMGHAWRFSDEEAKLLADPTAYAIEKGLPVEAGAVVRLDRTQPDGLYSIEQIVADWTADPAHPILHVPAEELLAEGDLSDAALETVAGGKSDGNNNNVNVACYVG
jgi:hypothetical protein